MIGALEMQRFYIQMNLFSVKKRYEILDERQNVAYTCRSEWFSTKKTLHVMDRQDRELMTIQRRAGAHASRYEVQLPEGLFISVVRERSYLHPEYRVEGLDWNISGDYFHYEYRIDDGENEIGNISKARANRKNQYQAEICETENALPVLAVVLAIDSSIVEARMIAGSITPV